MTMIFPTPSQRRPTHLPVCLSANGLTVSLSAEAALTLWVATIDGIIELKRDAATTPWRQTRQLLAGSHISSLLFEPTSGLLFAGSHYQGGLRLSRDGGSTWSESREGLRSAHVYSLEVQYVGDKTLLYVGTEPTMIYRSEDLGGSWHSLEGILEVPDTDKWRFGPPPHLAHLKNLAFHPSQPQTLYACVEQGDLLKSTDAGATWRAITSYEAAWHQFRRDMHRVVMVPSDPNKVYLSTGVGLFYSENAGETWEHLTTPDYHVGYPDPLFLDPLNEQTLYMAGASKAPNPSWTELRSAQPGVVRSDDGGRTWRDIRRGLPNPILGNIEAMALQHSSAQGTSLFLGTAVGEVYASPDAGEAWALVASGLPPISKGAHYRRFLSDDDRAQLERKLSALSAAKSPKP
jgi:photosystem II stability/assembly factor-like uncharacterized protein